VAAVLPAAAAALPAVEFHSMDRIARYPLSADHISYKTSFYSPGTT
jgi:hypothetical protein